MATIGILASADEKTWQTKFYETIFSDSNEVSVDRSTDGYTRGILFEQKQNVTSYGRSKTLGQALIYLSRFSRDGIPVPAKICLVSQDEQKCYIYDTDNYIDYANGIEKYANLKASDGIPGFEAGLVSEIITFDISNAAKCKDLLDFVQKAPKTVKVTITEHNVYGWSGFYYDHATEYKQKPEKKAFFAELRNPVGTLASFIAPWTGEETDFKYIMDMLNDPMTQKKLGAFYTPPQYAKLACGLVKQAITRVPEGNDYIILDRCAGTGNLEMYLGDGGEDILSHVIVSTYELKEWMVLKDRFGSRVRYIIPPIPKNPTALPELNEDGFLSGANALTRDIIDNPEVRKYIDNPHCTVILFENPPYIETTGIEFQKQGKGKESSGWKNSFVVQAMKSEVSGAVSNDMANAFIWSAFKYFLRQPTDSYIVFSPVKYWKSQHLVNKKFMGGYIFNRRFFHANSDYSILCTYWTNEDDKFTDSITATAMNIVNGVPVKDTECLIKKVHSMFSTSYYQKQLFESDTSGILSNRRDGQELVEDKKARITAIYNDNIVGYLMVQSNSFDQPALMVNLSTIAEYDGNGFYIRTNNFLKKLPMFAAGCFPFHNTLWYNNGIIMKSADKSAQYEADIASGKLGTFLFRTLFWTCMSHYPHMRSLKGSDGRLYLNQLCFDGDTLAKQKMDGFLSKGYTLTEEEHTLWDKMQHLLQMIRTCDEYNQDFTYGLYQIDEEINIKIPVGTNSDGTQKMDFKYGDLNNLVKEIKGLAKKYYIGNLVDTLFEYEFLK